MAPSENRQKILNLCYSLGAIGIFNVVLQFIIYPFLEKRMGADNYGVALSVLSLIAIINGACGYAVGCARLLGIEKGRTDNGDYNLILLAMGILCSIIGIVYLYTLGLLTPLSILLYVLLSITTMLRFYSEVEFRAKIDFFRFMIYYLLIALGYIVGLFFFNLSHQWMLVFITGELFCLLYAIARCSIYRPPFFKKTPHFRAILSSISFVLLSTLIDNITLHSDRILLLAITGSGVAVTTYYIASLVGKVIAMLTTPINTLIISYLVRYHGGLTKKLWGIVLLATALFGGLAFIGCLIVSPFLVRLLYPDNFETVKPYLLTAILGQVFYFVSSVLTTILLRFKGEKKQFIFNVGYAVQFFIIVIIGTVIGGLSGFAIAIVIANALRFLGAAVWGMIPTNPPAPTTVSEQ